MRTRVAVLLLSAIVLGCGSSARYAPVSGRVTLGGKPLANAEVSFQPTEGTNPGPGSLGKTDADGRYTLTVIGTNQAGAVVGPHRVSVTAFEGQEPDPAADTAPPRKSKVPDRYNARTTLTFDVPQGGTDAANFDLDAR